MPNVKVPPVVALPTAAEATVTLTGALSSSAASSDGACHLTSPEANVLSTGGEQVAKSGLWIQQYARRHTAFQYGRLAKLGIKHVLKMMASGSSSNHAAGVFQVDKEALFILVSRGMGPPRKGLRACTSPSLRFSNFALHNADDTLEL